MSYLERQGTMNAEIAETIELRIPALPCSPSLEVTHDSADYAGDVYEDSEYPYAPGFLNGIKCCTKCGATKTPQWREGPFGPKTLCNACGVKRTRKLRAEQDGNKRRRLTASPAKQYASAGNHHHHHHSSHHMSGSKTAQAKAAAAAALYAHQDAMDGYDSQGYDDDDGYDNAAYYHHPSPIKRPQRRAAEEAAVKTARYARTGEWKQEALSQPGGALATLMHTPTSSSDYSLPSSDCPEEVSFTPLAAEAAARSGLPGVPADCYAAVNLMTMSFKQPAEAEGMLAHPSSVNTTNPNTTTTAAAAVAAAVATANGHRAQHVVADVTMAQAAFDEAVAAKANENGLDPTAVADLYKTLPPAKVLELVRLNQELDSAVQEAHAATAAVAHMAAALANKQAMALRSKESALAATKRLRRFMIELDTQFGIDPKTLPRIRFVPKKET